MGFVTLHGVWNKSRCAYRKEGKHFFFEKKKQKTFARLISRFMGYPCE
jgi:hypothetical protein